MTESTNAEPSPESRVFLSYARGDDESFVRRLYDDLVEAGFIVWFDRESLLSRGLTFHQEIRDAIRTEVDRVVYVGGPKAAQSPYVREEWQLALEFDHVVITPILRLGDYDGIPGELSLLHCEDFRDDAHYETALAKLIENLRQPNPCLGALFGVPNLPAHFLARPELMRRVRDALLVDLQTPQVITSADARVGMQGMGGIGKSVLAAALARNRQVRAAYPDGVAWISFGQDLADSDLVSRQRDLAWHLGGDTDFETLVQGQAVLRDLLQGKASLLVLDDVWCATDTKAFDITGPRCRTLITTRDAGVLHALNGELVPVSLFTEPEALQLLGVAVGVRVADLPPEAGEVANECGFLPLALALSGGMAKKRSGDFRSVLERLRRADLEKIADRESINEAHRSIWRAMQASVEMLSEDEQRRFAELAVFSTDETVPEAAAATLWAHTGDLDDLDAEDLLINLGERSLIQLDSKKDDTGDPSHRFTLHDLLYDYAVRIAGDLKLVHRALVDAYRGSSPEGWASGPNDGYYLERIFHHLLVLEAWDEIIGDEENPGLLCDLRFIEAKCGAELGYELSADYSVAMEKLPELREEREKAQEARQRCVDYANALAEYAGKWQAGDDVPLPKPPPACEPSPGLSQDQVVAAAAPTRVNRLRRFAGFYIGNRHVIAEHAGWTLPLAGNYGESGLIVEQAERFLGPIGSLWLLRRPGVPEPPLFPAGRAVLEGHSGYVAAVAASADFYRALSAGMDRTLRLWDLESGACRAVFEGHSGPVDAVAASANFSRALSGSGDKTLRLWDLESGECRAVLEGHSSGVTTVTASADFSRALSGSADATLRLWDLESCECRAVLEGHSREVKAVAASADFSRALSASGDKTLRLWDLESGACRATYYAGSAIVSVTADFKRGRVVCGTGNGQVHFLSLMRGNEIVRMDGPVD